MCACGMCDGNACVGVYVMEVWVGGGWRCVCVGDGGACVCVCGVMCVYVCVCVCVCMCVCECGACAYKLVGVSVYIS